MTNKIEQYLYVYDEKKGTFPEKWKVVDDNDTSEISSKINGHIKKKDLDKSSESLRSNYSAVHYVINSSYANSWDAVENNYPGLFYEHFSNNPNQNNKEQIKPDITSQLPFTTKINSGTQQGSFFILILAASGIIAGWNMYLDIKSIGSTFAWLYELIFFQSHYLLVSIHVPIMVGVAIYYLLTFSYSLIKKITVAQDGITIWPSKQFIAWDKVDEVYASEVTDEYDKMPLFGSSLVLITFDGKRHAISNRFENISLMVSLIEHQLEEPMMKHLYEKICQEGFVGFSKNIGLTEKTVIFNTRTKRVELGLNDISKIYCDKKILELYDLEGKYIFLESTQNMKNSIFFEKLFKELKSNILKSSTHHR